MRLLLHINGEHVTVEAGQEDDGYGLLWALREQLGLTGSKPGCGEGQCGACTVLVDGAAMRSCITPAEEAAGKSVLTIEGLERDGQLHPLQQAFLDHEAFQCGYCTPGMIMSALGLLNSCPDPNYVQIISALDGNICRCGTYNRIVQAVRQAAFQMQANAPDEGVQPAQEAPV